MSPDPFEPVASEPMVEHSLSACRFYLADRLFRYPESVSENLVCDSNGCAVARGVLKPMEEREMAVLSEELRLVALFWLNDLEVGGEEFDSETVQRGIDLVRNLIRPRLTEQAPAGLAGREPDAPSAGSDTARQTA